MLRLPGCRGTGCKLATACPAAGLLLAAALPSPWYDLLVWAALPALLRPRRPVALARLTALSIAYVPGRVLGMTPQVEEPRRLGSVERWCCVVWRSVSSSARRAERVCRGAGPVEQVRDRCREDERHCQGGADLRGSPPPSRRG